MYADYLATDAELAAAEDEALDAMRGTASRIAAWVGDHGSWQAARMIVVSIQQAQTKTDAKDWRDRLATHSRSFLRCVFANPFRATAVNASWLVWNERTVPRLAQAIYDERAFDRLPILADALEEAGCTDADILNHCRQPGEHVRGCWVVDLLLGQS